MEYIDKFRIDGNVCIITGGAGLLGRMHAEAVLEGKGIPVLLDISEPALERVEELLTDKYPEGTIEAFGTDITDRAGLERIRDILLEKYGHVDVLINNAANNPKVEGGCQNLGALKFVDFPIEIWNADIAVGLTERCSVRKYLGRRWSARRKASY